LIHFSDVLFKMTTKNIISISLFVSLGFEGFEHFLHRV
jgi:hypothetical protein